ncbi:MAG: chorismate mutase [Anaerolineae bacterium]|nr:chorismate mutase [Anaerolineae bacterium]
MAEHEGEWSKEQGGRRTESGGPKTEDGGLASYPVCRGVRGATTASANTREAILEATADLVQRLLAANNIQTEDIASVMFSTTADLTAEFPAVVRTQVGWQDLALECYQEMGVPGALQRCIRVLIHWNTRRSMREIVHVYVRGAEGLRPDRVKSS